MTPPLQIVIAGTGTEVGKTWLAAGLARAVVEAGLSVRAVKPAQSFEPGSGPTDAEVLADATGQHAADVCPPRRWYEVPMAPPMAADVLGRPGFTIADLVDEVAGPASSAEVVLVESAGGVRSPLADDGDTVDLVAGLDPDLVLLVGDAGLGTINAVRLCLDALEPAPTAVFLNRFDPTDDLHVRNLAWLVEREGCDIETDLDVLADRVVALTDDVARAEGVSLEDDKVEE